MSATFRIVGGDCVEALAAMPAASVDAVVCDPPYALSFMGKTWDQFGGPLGRGVGRARGGGRERGGAMQAGEYDQSPTGNRAFQAWCEAWAREALRVLKPGGHLLAFGGTRTYHRLTCGLEDAGFEIRDCLSWLYGSGFPKSLDVSKAIDKAAGVEREVVGSRAQAPKFNVAQTGGSNTGYNRRLDEDGAVAEFDVTVPATPEAQAWAGWGTALKPAHEPIVLARKPLAGTVAGNVLAHGTGALNVDATRIRPASELPNGAGRPACSSGDTGASHTASQPPRTPSTVLAESVGSLPEPRSRLLANAFACALRGQSLPDSPGDCPPCPGCDGGLARLGAAVAQASARPQGDARGPLDPQWTAQRIREGRCVDHPSIWGDLAQLVEAASPSGTVYSRGRMGEASADRRYTERGGTNFAPTPGPRGGDALGRWPANVVLDPEAAAMLDEQTGEQKSGVAVNRNREPGTMTSWLGTRASQVGDDVGYGDSGGASRFFYCAKTSSAERNAGLDGFEAVEVRITEGHGRGAINTSKASDGGVRENRPRQNVHPTVKPIALMRWLCRLVTPPGGTVLDPFTGSGTTGCAAVLEGFDFVGCEREPEYVAIAEARIAWWAAHPEGVELVERLEAERERKAVAESGQLDLLGGEAA